jgi:hypothetical protein
MIAAQTTIRCSDPLPSQISPGPTLLNAYSSNLDPPLSLLDAVRIH